MLSAIFGILYTKCRLKIGQPILILLLSDTESNAPLYYVMF